MLWNLGYGSFKVIENGTFDNLDHRLPISLLLYVQCTICILYHFRNVWRCSHPPPLPPHGHIWDVMLVWRKGNIEKTVSVLHYYNGAQRYEQFLQIGQLYRALILLSLALFRAPLCLRSSWCYICIKFFCLHPSLYLLVSWLTIILQCYDTVGWVIWPVKSSPKWPIMCRVGR